MMQCWNRVQHSANLGTRVDVRDNGRRALRHFCGQRGLLHVSTADGKPEQAFQRGILEVPCPGDRPRAGQELGYRLEPNPTRGRSRTDSAAEGSKGFFGNDALLPQRPAEGHILRHQVVDGHSSYSRLKSPTMRKAARST